MKGTTKYVALDVHQAMTVASVREGGGRIIARSIFPTEEQALVDFFQGMRGAVHVTFEEGTQAQWPHDLLVGRVDRVLVCDRRVEKRQGRKDDQADARLLMGHFDGLAQKQGEEVRVGGLSSYGPKPHRGPFIHVDTRGTPARWQTPLPEDAIRPRRAFLLPPNR